MGKGDKGNAERLRRDLAALVRQLILRRATLESAEQRDRDRS